MGHLAHRIGGSDPNRIQGIMGRIEHPSQGRHPPRTLAMIRRTAAFLLTLTLLSCSGSSTSPPPPPAAVATVTVSPLTAAVQVGQTVALSAATLDASSGVLTGRTVNWSSNPQSVATVVNGVVTGVSEGVATITATSEGRSGSAQVTVTPAPVETVVVTPPTASVQVGQTVALSAATLAVGGGTLSGRTVTWSSNPESVATVLNGVVTGVSAGVATITATSEGKSGTAQVTVTLPLPFTAWQSVRIGTVGGQTSEGGVVSLASLGTVGVLVSFSSGRTGQQVALVDNGTFHWANGTLTRVAPAGGAPFQLLGISAVEPGMAFAYHGFNSPIYRWNGSAWSTLPALPMGLSTIVPPQAMAGGTVAALARQGSAGAGMDRVYRWNGSSWSELFSVATLAGQYGGEFWLASPTEGIYLSATQSGDYVLRQWSGGPTLTNLPAVPGAPFNFRPQVFGNTLTDFYLYSATTRNRLYHWNGTEWSVIQQGFPELESISGFTMCETKPVVVSNVGRVYRLDGAAFVRLGADADNLLLGFTGGNRAVSCAADGTLRTAAGNGSVSRWNGSAWVLETFAPSLHLARAVAPNLAWATAGSHLLYRWNGSTWSEAYRGSTDPTRHIGSLMGWPDGRLIAAYRSRSVPMNAELGSLPPQGVLRFDGMHWSSEVGADLALVNAVWGPNYNDVFAASGDGRVLRSRNGGGWQTVSGIGTPLHMIDGSGESFALAIGPGLRTVLWNGTEWTEVVASVAGTTGIRVEHLYAPGPGEAWVVLGPRVLRFTGSGWQDVDMALAGGSTNVRTLAIFGTGPTDVYLLRGSFSGGPRMLYRWNGTAWSTITTISPGDPDWAETGSAAPGLAIIPGINGTLHVSQNGGN